MHGARRRCGEETIMTVLHGITDEEIRRILPSIDYTEALTITATRGDVRAACKDATTYGFRAVVAFPQHLGILVDEVAGTAVRAQIPVGFPCGGQTTHVKCREAEEGLQRGANDLDMVMNLSAFKEGDYSRVSRDIVEVRTIVDQFKVPFKVIIEVGILTDDEKVKAARLAEDCGARYVKTCTGFGPGRATVHDVALLRATLRKETGIKASGHVASLEDGVALVRAGADIVAMRRFLVEQLESIGWVPGSKPSVPTVDKR
jgi:deoxyribose-phosphate aldolase